MLVKVALVKEPQAYGLNSWVLQNLPNDSRPVRMRLPEFMESLEMNTLSDTGSTKQSAVRMRQLAWDQVRYVKNERGEVFFRDPFVEKAFEMYVAEVDTSRPWMITRETGVETIKYLDDVAGCWLMDRIYNWYRGVA